MWGKSWKIPSPFARPRPWPPKTPAFSQSSFSLCQGTAFSLSNPSVTEPPLTLRRRWQAFVGKGLFRRPLSHLVCPRSRVCDVILCDLDVHVVLVESVSSFLIWLFPISSQKQLSTNAVRIVWVGLPFGIICGFAFISALVVCNCSYWSFLEATTTGATSIVASQLLLHNFPLFWLQTVGIGVSIEIYI